MTTTAPLPLAQSRVFVTGGGGFIGSVIVRLLVEENATVRCLLRKTSKLERLAGLVYERTEGDVRDKASLVKGMDGCDYAIHLAGLSSWDDIDSPAMQEVTETGTRQVLEAARDNGLKKVVFASSAVAINASEEPRVFDETARFDADDRDLGYSRHKRAAEKLCLAANAEGLPVTICNPTEVYGPHDTGLITASTLVDFAKSSPVMVCAGGTSVAYVDDVAQGFVRALQQGGPGERYILGGENLTVRQLAELTLDILALKKRIVQMPNAMIRGIAKGARTLHIPLPFNPRVIPYATRYWFMDSSKATRELGVTFRSARAALSPTLSWLRDAGHIPAHPSGSGPHISGPSR